MPSDLRSIRLPNEARALVSTRRAAEKLRGDEAFDHAISAAREACHQNLAQLFYTLSLAYFGQAERRNGEVFIRESVLTPEEIFPKLARASAISKSLDAAGFDEQAILELANAPAVGGSYRARSRRWCRASIEASGGRHLGALELLAAHLLLDGAQDAALAVYGLVAKESGSAKQRGFALANCGKALLDLGRPRAAADACEKAIRASNEDGLTLANLAVSRLLIKDIRGALRAYTRLARQSGRDVALWEKLPRLLRSDLEFARRHVGIPVQDFQGMWKELQSLGLLGRNRRSPDPSVET